MRNNMNGKGVGAMRNKRSTTYHVGRLVKLSALLLMVLLMAMSLLAHDFALLAAGHEKLKVKPGAAPIASKGQDLRARPEGGIDYDFYDIRIHSPTGGGAVQRAAGHWGPAPASRSAYSLGNTVTGPAEGDAEAIARDFLQSQADPRDGPSGGGSLELRYEFQTGAAGLTHLVFRETYDGVPVFGGQVLVHILDDGSILKADLPRSYVAPEGPPAPTLGSEVAVRVAAAAVFPGARLKVQQVSKPTGPDRKTVFTANPLVGEVPASLVHFPSAAGTELAWQVFLLSPTRTEYFHVLVSAEYERVLFSRNLMIEEGPEGEVFAAARTDSDTDPGTVNPDHGPVSIEPFTGYPASAGPCPEPIYPAGVVPGPTGCWLPGESTAGNNVVVLGDLDGDDNFEPIFGPSGHFDFGFSNAYEATGRFLDDTKAAVANVFYWNNVVHDWLYVLGFTEEAGNFQEDNYGRGGLEADPVIAYSELTDGTNNAFMGTPPDGLEPFMGMFLFTDPPFRRVDVSFDVDIIIHEYVHGLTNRLVGGPSNADALWYWQSGALGEGWGDAYAAALTNDPVMGEYSTDNPGTGIRSVSYDDSPYTFGRMATILELPINAGIPLGHPEVHADGEIWATVLWDLREYMINANPDAVAGRHLYDLLVTTALPLTPPRPSMLDARDAILLATQALDEGATGMGGADQCGVWDTFAARGFGASAALNHVNENLVYNDTALSVFEAFDVPPVCGGTAPGPGTDVFFDDVEAGNIGWTAEGLWHISSLKGSGSWYFGLEATNSYDTGSVAFGGLTSPPIDLTDAARATLEWDQSMKTESHFSTVFSYDVGWVLVSTDDGASWETVSYLNHDTDPGAVAFDHHIVDLSRFAGEEVLVQFHFDTADSYANEFEGWFVDNIRVAKLPDPDAEGAVLVPDTTVSGTVDVIGDHDDWTFNSTPSLFARVDLTRSVDSPLDTMVELIDPSGAVVGRNDDGGLGHNSLLIVELQHSGAYTVSVSGHNSTGEYDLLVTFLTITDVGGGPIQALLEAGVGTFSGGVDYTGDEDDFTFTGEAGQFIEIMLDQSTPSDLNPLVELIDPSGAVEAWDNNSGAGENASIVWPLGQNGTYTIRAKGNGSLGAYDLTVLFPTVVDTGGGTIADGEPQSAGIEYIGDSDSWTFTGFEGDLIRVTLEADPVGSLDPFLSLVDPAGLLMTGNDDSGLGNSALIELPLPADGEFTLQAYGQDPQTPQFAGMEPTGPRNMLGGYTLTFEFVTDTGEGGFIVGGAAVFGGIDVPGDYDMWTLDATAGDGIMIAMFRDGASLIDGVLELYSPSGVLVAGADDTESSRDPLLEYSATETGTYSLYVFDPWINSIGDYRLEMVPDIGGGPIAFGETLEGMIDIEGDADSWFFEHSGLNEITITMNAPPESGVDLILSLYAPNGAFVGSDDGDGHPNAELGTTAIEQGTYTIVAEAPDDYVGGYELSLYGAPVPVPVSVNTLPNGDFEAESFDQWRALSTASGQWVINDGTYEPSFDGPLPPYEGNFSALSEQYGPSLNVLVRDVFLDPGLAFAQLIWADRVRNHHSAFAEGQQEYRAEIRDTDHNLLEVMYSTVEGGELVTEWETRSFDLSPYIGQTIRLVFMQRSFFYDFNLHLDAVQIFATADLGPCEFPTLIGTPGDDILVGTPFDDVIAGLDGDDIILGQGGHDTICGGAGDDVLDGGTGRDRLFGQQGDDLLLGRGGSDRLWGGPGDDIIKGGLHKDSLWGGKGDDTLKGQLGDDTLTGGPGDDVLKGQGGDDVLKGGGGDDILKGGPGDDTLDGGPGNNILKN